jgi:hypothetical protein
MDHPHIMVRSLIKPRAFYGRVVSMSYAMGTKRGSKLTAVEVETELGKPASKRPQSRVTAATAKGVATWLGCGDKRGPVARRFRAQVLDPYGVYPELPDDCYCVGRAYFARRPGSDVWVEFGDLPKKTRDALWKRHQAKLAFPAALGLTVTQMPASTVDTQPTPSPSGGS